MQNLHTAFAALCFLSWYKRIRRDVTHQLQRLRNRGSSYRNLCIGAAVLNLHRCMKFQPLTAAFFQVDFPIENVFLFQYFGF